MNVHEAAELMTRIVANYPNGNWPNSTISEWTKDLQGYDAGIAEQARQSLKRTFASNGTRKYQAPVWADFTDAYNAAKPRPDWQPRMEQLPTIERMRELANAARAQLGKERT